VRTKHRLKTVYILMLLLSSAMVMAQEETQEAMLEDGNPRSIVPISNDNLINEFRDQFKVAHRGAQIHLEELSGEWACEIWYLDRSADMALTGAQRVENYLLRFSKRISKQKKEEEISDGMLSLRAEVVSYHDKKRSQSEVRIGDRQIASGRAETRALNEMAHDKNLPTVDEIALVWNGPLKTLLIERSYLYQGPASIFDGKDLAANNRKKHPAAISTYRVPRAYSVCSKSI